MLLLLVVRLLLFGVFGAGGAIVAAVCLLFAVGAKAVLFVFVVAVADVGAIVDVGALTKNNW
eukprot:m.31844 g.31844  ORF g.31844 m.31844 type:complete len:62 (+) comp9852_c0_seq1:126-311(+)